MKNEEQQIAVKAPAVKKTTKKANKTQEAVERATELPGKQASVAAEMKNREH
jgi:hypothetical protein